VLCTKQYYNTTSTDDLAVKKTQIKNMSKLKSDQIRQSTALENNNKEDVLLGKGYFEKLTRIGMSKP